MTGPSFPFFQPNVSPSWTFQDPGDIGGIGGALGGLVETMQKQKMLQMQEEQNAMQHEQLMGAIQARQLQHQKDLDELGLRKKEIAADQADKERAHELTLLSRQDKQKEQKVKDAAGNAQGAAADAAVLPGVADANQQEAMDPISSFLLSLLHPAESGLGGEDPQGEAISVAMKNEKEKLDTMQAPWQAGAADSTLFNKVTGETGARLGKTVKSGGAGTTTTLPDGTVIETGPDSTRKQLAGQDKRMGADLDAAKKAIQTIPATIQAARGASNVKTGQLGPLKQSFGKWMIATGMASKEQMADTQNSEAYMLAAVRNSLGILASGAYGTGNSITEQDRRAAEKLSGADLSLEPRTIKLTQRFALLSQAQMLEQYKAKLDALKARPYKGYTAADIEAEYGAAVGGSEGLQRQIDLLRKEAEKVLSGAEVDQIANGTSMTPAQAKAARGK